MFRCNLDRVGHLAKMFSPPGNAIGFRQLVGRETYRDKIISFQHQITLMKNAIRAWRGWPMAKALPCAAALIRNDSRLRVIRPDDREQRG